jgi:hypothetical protein
MTALVTIKSARERLVNTTSDFGGMDGSTGDCRAAEVAEGCDIMIWRLVSCLCLVELLLRQKGLMKAQHHGCCCTPLHISVHDRDCPRSM